MRIKQNVIYSKILKINKIICYINKKRKFTEQDEGKEKERLM